MGTCSTFGRFSHTNHIWSPLDKFGTNTLSQTVNWHWGNHFRSSNVFLNSNFYSLIYWRAVKGAHFDLLSIWNYLEHQFDGLLSCIFILMLILWFTLIDCKLVPSFRCFVKIKTQKTRSQWMARNNCINFFVYFLSLTGASFGKWSNGLLSIWNICKAIRNREEPTLGKCRQFLLCVFCNRIKTKIRKYGQTLKKSNSELKQLF